LIFFLQIYDVIKTMTLKSYKDVEKQRQSNWVREIVQDTCHVEEYVLETIKNRYVTCWYRY